MEDDIRVAATQSIVDSWKPRDQRGRDSKKRFQEQLDKLANQSDADNETEITSTAVVLGPQGTLLHAHDLMPSWIPPVGQVSHGESPTDAALRAAQSETGAVVSHPKEGPEVVGVDVEETSDGVTRLDIRFLLFADRDKVDPQGRWFSDEEAKKIADESYRHALEVAHEIRDEASRS